MDISGLEAKGIGAEGCPRAKEVSVVADLRVLESCVNVYVLLAVVMRMVLQARVDCSKSRILSEGLQRQSVAGLKATIY